MDRNPGLQARERGGGTSGGVERGPDAALLPLTPRTEEPMFPTEAERTAQLSPQGETARFDRADECLEAVMAEGRALLAEQDEVEAIDLFDQD